MKNRLFRKGLVWLIVLAMLLPAGPALLSGAEELIKGDPLAALMDEIGYIPVPAEEEIAQAPSGAQYVENELILFFHDSVGESRARALLNRENCVITGYNKLLNMYTVAVRAESYEALEALAAALQALPEIALAEPDGVTELEDYIPDDPWQEGTTLVNWTGTGGSNWGLKAIGLPEAWDMMGVDAPVYPYTPVSVGVVDSGINLSHPEFAEPGDGMEVANLSSNGYNYSGSDHGSHVSGTIAAAADNQLGITGIVHNGALSFASAGISERGLSDSLLLDGLARVVESGAQAINFSVGGGGTASFALAMAKLLAQGYDFLVVQAAGNDGTNAVNAGCFVFDEPTAGQYAAPYGLAAEDLINRVLVVAAAENFRDAEKGYRLTSFSNYGERVDIAAPGANIYSSNWTGYGTASGTSMAAPHATGAASILWSRHPDLNAAEVKEIISHIQATGPAFGYFTSDETAYRMLHLPLALAYADAFAAGREAMREKDLIISSPVQNVYDPLVVDYSGDSLQILQDGIYTVSMRAPVTADQIVVPPGVKATITFRGLSLTTPPSFQGAEISLNLVGESYIESELGFLMGDKITVTGAANAGMAQSGGFWLASELELRGGSLFVPEAAAFALDISGGELDAPSLTAEDVHMTGGRLIAGGELGLPGLTVFDVEDGILEADELRGAALSLRGGTVSAARIDDAACDIIITGGLLTVEDGIDAGAFVIGGGAVVALNGGGGAAIRAASAQFGGGTVIASDGGVEGISAGSDGFVFATQIEGLGASTGFMRIDDAAGCEIDKAGKKITLRADLAVPAGTALEVPPGWTIDLDGSKLINDGLIINPQAILGGEIEGGGSVVYGDYILQSAQNTYSADVVSYTDNTLTIRQNGGYTVLMRPGVAETRRDVIRVASGLDAVTLTLGGVQAATMRTPLETGSDTDVFLLLEGDSSLTGEEIETGGVLLGRNASLTIDGTGSLTARGAKYMPGIGGLFTQGDEKNITILGGVVNAIGGELGAGIGFGSYEYGYKLSINLAGGEVTAQGGEGAAGIGGGYQASTPDITVSGGTVNAAGGLFGAGIGGGGKVPMLMDSRISSGVIAIHGGTVEAESGVGGAGIGSGGLSQGEHIVITGGEVTARGQTEGYNGGAGIGGGSLEAPFLYEDSVGIIEISGGTVNASAESWCAAIGGGRRSFGGQVKISGGDITAQGGGSYNGTGIGAGVILFGDISVDISGGTVYAEGSSFAPGIGGGGTGGMGSGDAHVYVNISGGDITAQGGDECSGIGGRSSNLPGETVVNISGGLIHSTGGYYAAGIGGAYYGAGDAINITGGVIYAQRGISFGGSVPPAPTDIGLSSFAEPSTGSVSGDAVVFAYNGIQGLTFTEGIVFQTPDHAGEFFGSRVMVMEDCVFPPDHYLPIPDGGALAVKDTKTLWNEGTIEFLGSGLVLADWYKDSVLVQETPGFGDLIESGWILGPDTPPAIIPVMGISLNESALTLEKLETFQLAAEVIPINAANPAVLWSSGDESVATVDANGIVTALSGGTALITATTVDGGRSAVCLVTVLEPVTGVALNIHNVTRQRGDGYQYTATVYPENATNKALAWSSSDESVCVVSASGYAQAVGGGTATITVTTAEGGYTDTSSFTVFILAEKIILNETSHTMDAGDTFQLIETFLPAETTTQKLVQWSSSDPSVATVSNTGLVTGQGGGTATITCTSLLYSNLKASCDFTVNPGTEAVTGVTLNFPGLSQNKGATYPLQATVLPINASNKNVSWSSSDTSVATVSENGLVSFVGGGSCVVTVTTQDGGFTATCAITTNVPATGVSLNITSHTMNVGDTVTLMPEVAPEDGTYKYVQWTSSDSTVATAVNNMNPSVGSVVTAVGEGTATITCTTISGGFTATCEITVVPVTGPGDEEDPEILDIHPDIIVDDYNDYIYGFKDKLRIEDIIGEDGATDGVYLQVKGNGRFVADSPGEYVGTGYVINFVDYVNDTVTPYTMVL
ncbi:MAG: Ig-like domain-containing protein, partial [Oscillospiraceae bacterium]|nr:Ig-like domain-containing protein [Oscillospiraceae bacterium]